MKKAIIVINIFITISTLLVLYNIYYFHEHRLGNYLYSFFHFKVEESNLPNLFFDVGYYWYSGGLGGSEIKISNSEAFDQGKKYYNRKYYPSEKKLNFTGWQLPRSIFSVQPWIISGTDPDTNEYIMVKGNIHYSFNGILFKLLWLFIIIDFLAVLSKIIYWQYKKKKDFASGKEIEELTIKKESKILTYSPMAIFSPVFIIFILLFAHFGSEYEFYTFYWLKLIMPIFNLLGIVFSIMGFMECVRKKIKGLWLAVIGIILGGIGIWVHLIILLKGLNL
ncbi:MAG: hypothetical protein ABIH38_03880 [Patescibacteria group bacterium]